MARHLYIGNDVAVSYSSGVLANGALDIQKLSASGPTPMLPGDTIADSAQFRIVQGNGTTNIVSPWVYGKDVINWSGKSHVAQVAQVGTLAFSGTAGAAYTLECKLINKTNGAEPFELKSYEISVASGNANTVVSAALAVAINADLPHWIKTCSDSSGTITITGYKKGETKADGSVQGDVVLWDFADNSGDWDTTTVTVDVDATSAANRGAGDGYYVKQLEEDLRGAQYGYYNRIELPVTPSLVTEVAEPYDMYCIAATKDGSSSSQIHGVDNIIELNIAFDNGTAALTSALEGVLNPYLLSAGFANVNL
tara:strand:+ start:1017 stop:1946 length:930 start_codon:yes stop_codon:yes gene_type:complete